MLISVCRCKKDVASFKFGVVYEILRLYDKCAVLLNSEGCECTMERDTYEENFSFIGVVNEVGTV